MEFLHRHKKWFIGGLTGLAVVFMIFTGRQGYEQGFMRSGVGFVTASGQGLFAGIGDWFGARWESFRGINRLQAENQLLRAQNDFLEIENNRFLHLEEENRMLAELLELQRHYAGYATLGANVVSRDPSNWSTSFTIDRGSRDGVVVDMAVLAPGGLAGRISLVGPNYSVVTPLTQDGAAVTSVSLRSGWTGVVSGDVNLTSRGVLRMNHIEQDADLVPGDYVMTSQMSAIFPPGIMVGRITEFGQTPGGLRYAHVLPLVDFNRINNVLIVTGEFGFEQENGGQ